MTEKRQPDLQETLSALKDGETTDWELRKVLQQGADDSVILERWQSYHLISAALHHDIQTGADISGAVRERLREERAGVAGWLITARKPLAQTAIAASVATFAVIGVQQYQLASVAPVEQSPTVAASAESNMGTAAPMQLPEGFALPNLTTQNVSSSPSRAVGVNNAPVKVLSVQVPVFDRDALRMHFESSLTNHSTNAAEATQLIIPRARTPQADE